jgi:prefoldin subunit 5
MTSDSKSWPLLEERAPFATASRTRPSQSRKVPRSPWLLTGLAFICGGLVSAAAFSIGWRHQAQRDTAAQTALAAATARVHRLEHRIGTLRVSLGTARSTAAAATAAETALAHAGANVAAEATDAGGNGTAVASSAGALGAATSRLASELKTLDTYLTATPAAQLDAGYIATQTAYLARQLSPLQGDAGTLGNSVSSLETTLRRLGRDARALTSG